MTEDALAARLRVPVVLATVLVIPAVVIEATATSPEARTSGQMLNWLIWTVLVFEIAALLWVAEDRRAWLRQHPLELALVVVTVPFLPASMQAARLLRLARLVRLVLVFRLAQRLFSPTGLGFAAFVATIAVLAGGAAYQAAEASQDPAPTLWDGVWWAMTTLTTVGYGDLSPQTALGRIVGIVLMVVGIGFVALLTGAIATRFVQAAEERGQQEPATAPPATLEAEFAEIARRLAHLEARVVKPRSEVDRTSSHPTETRS